MYPSGLVCPTCISHAFLPWGFCWSEENNCCGDVTSGVYQNIKTKNVCFIGELFCSKLGLNLSLLLTMPDLCSAVCSHCSSSLADVTDLIAWMSLPTAHPVPQGDRHSRRAGRRLLHGLLPIQRDPDLLMATRSPPHLNGAGLTIHVCRRA